MGMPVVTVAAGGMPVIDVSATHKLGLPVSEAANGLGKAVTKVTSSGTPVVYDVGPIWADAWTLDTAQKPAAVLDFVGNQYFDGSNSNAALSSLTTNASRDSGGLICNAGNINAIGNFLAGLKNAGGATVVAEIGGGNNTVAYGILSMSSGGPDSIMIANGPTNTMDSFNGTGIPGPAGAPVDFSKTATFATSYNNAGAIADATGGVVLTAAKNFSAITTAQLGSYNGVSLWPGRIRSIAVYTSKLADKYLKNMSWPGAWNKPFNGNTGVGFGVSGYVTCGLPLGAYFKNAAPWTLVGSGIVPASHIGVLSVLFTNVVNAGAPPWYGHEVYVEANGKLRCRIMCGWAGGAATTHIIQVNGGTIVADDKWRVIGCSYDGSGLASGVKLYVDGVPETLTVDYNNLDAASDANIGQFQFGGQWGSIPYGYVDLFAMSNIARSASYFTSIMATRTRPGVDANTLAYYDFREGSGTTTADRSGNNYTGTFNGPVAWI